MAGATSCRLRNFTLVPLNELRCASNSSAASRLPSALVRGERPCTMRCASCMQLVANRASWSKSTEIASRSFCARFARARTERAKPLSSCPRPSCISCAMRRCSPPLRHTDRKHERAGLAAAVDRLRPHFDLKQTSVLGAMLSFEGFQRQIRGHDRIVDPGQHRLVWTGGQDLDAARYQLHPAPAVLTHGGIIHQKKP